MMGEHNHLADREKWLIKRIQSANTMGHWCYEAFPTNEIDCSHGFPVPHGDLRYDADCTCGARIVAFLSEQGWRVEPLKPDASIPYRPR